MEMVDHTVLVYRCLLHRMTKSGSSSCSCWL